MGRPLSDLGAARLALLVWLVSMAVTALLWQQASQDAEQELRADFMHEVASAQRSIETELAAKASVLKSFAGLFNASSEVTRQDFRVFFESLSLDQGVHNFAAVTYVESVPASKLDQHLARVRRDGQTDYQIHPVEPREAYAPVVYIEPFSGDNRKVPGFDNFSVLPARVAMQRARDSGALTLSGKLTLKQDEGKGVPGIVIYQPLYRPGTAPNTPALRQTHLLGWVNLPFRAADLLKHALPQNFENIALEVFDGNSQSLDTLLFDSDATPTFELPVAAGFESVRTLVFGGHTWTLVFRALPGFGSQAVAQGPQLLLLAGLLLSTLLAVVVALVGRAQQRRHDLAQKMVALAAAQGREAERAASAEILHQNAWAMNEAQRIGQIGSYVTDVQTGLWQGSLMLDEIFGIDASFAKTVDNWSRLVAPESQAELLDFYHQMVAGNSKIKKDYKIIRPADGQIRWVSALGELTFDANGQPLLLRGTIQDITDRKLAEMGLRDSAFAARLALDSANALTRKLEKAQAELAEREEIYRSIVTQAVDGMVMIDTSTLAYVEFNDAACQDLGYSREEFARLTLVDVQGELDAEATRTGVAGMVDAKTSSFETLHRHKDGSLRNAYVRSSIVWRAGLPYLVGIVSDITERKAGEYELQNYRDKLEQMVLAKTASLQQVVEAFQASEARYRRLVDNSHDIIYTINTSCLLTFVSPSWTLLMGHPVEKVLGKPFADIIHPADLVDSRAAIQRVMVTGASLQGLEHRTQHQDGSWHWFNTNGTALRDESGKVIGFEGTAGDITVRKQVEVALRASRQRYLSLIENLSDVLLTLTPAGIIDYVSPQWTVEFGHAVGEVLNQPFERFVHPDHRAGCVASIGQVFASGTRQNGVEYQALCKNGSYLWCSAKSSLLKDPSSGAVTLIALVRNISKSKADQQALQWSVSLLNATIESAAHGVLAVNSGGQVTLWNQRFAELWRMPPELLNAPDQRHLQAFAAAQMGQPKQFIARVNAIYDQPQVASNEILELADGRSFRQISHPQKIGDEVIGRVWSFDDITDLKRAEAAANNASQTKSEFLANMSHEIRTPMNGVVGMVDILQQTELTADQQRMLGTIYHSSLALLHILNDILDYSKIESGKLAVEQIPVNLRDVAQEVHQLLSSTAQAKSLDLSVWVTPELPGWVYSDPTRLRQVLLNLMGNAIKFTRSTPDKPGRVQLRVTASPQPDGQRCLQLHLIDNGIGMSEELVSQLFQPFTQADVSTSRQFGGTGLGLSISQRLASLMGGQISVGSKLGQGSEFTLTLPLQEAPAALVHELMSERRALPRFSKTPGAAPAVVGTGPLILLAEDNETNRDVLYQQLKLLGYSAELAEDGRVALEKWRSGQFALLLTDCHMPQMDGFALTAAIRAAEGPGQHLPIIAVTANVMQGEVQRCLNSGMDDYLSKPLRLQELAAMLAKWLPQADQPEASPVLLAADRRSSPADEPLPNPPWPVWDADTLGKMIGDNPEMQQTLLRKFLQNAQRQVQQIGTAALAHDTRQIADIAHKLKSSARTVGALALGELCEEIETTGLADQSALCLELAAALPDALAGAAEMIGVTLRRFDQTHSPG